ncbi:hypothetical protein [Lewinella cohaerens]|uniref:hypothetical protein n=1 Tax=Lewinella cohaerens TaxID=70995 RepID=UPI0003727669|nr:hypothetical protein [Lewinella cohaerens]
MNILLILAFATALIGAVAILSYFQDRSEEKNFIKSAKGAVFYVFYMGGIFISIFIFPSMIFSRFYPESTLLGDFYNSFSADGKYLWGEISYWKEILIWVILAVASVTGMYALLNYFSEKTAVRK